MKKNNFLLRTTYIITALLGLIRCFSNQGDQGKKNAQSGNSWDKYYQISDSSVLYKGEEIVGADIATFVTLSENYAKDANTAYYCSEHRNSRDYYTTKSRQITYLKSADAETFQLVGDIYSGVAKDKKQAYIDGISFPIADYQSFEIVDTKFTKDSLQVYFKFEKVHNADAPSFQKIDQFYYFDKNRAYFLDGETLKSISCNGANFQPLTYPYSKDDQKVFYKEKLILEANAKSFEILGNSYAKDFQRVYFEDRILSNVISADFALVPGYENTTFAFPYGHDKESVYFETKKLNGRDPATFIILDFGYTKDATNVFFNDVKMANVDVGTFEVYPHQVGDGDAKDKNHVFFQGKVVSNN